MEHLRLNVERAWIERLKGGISHEHTLLESELNALRAWFRARGDEPGAVFLSNLKRPISGVHLNRMIRKYATAVGLPEEKRHFHCLRHTCATQLPEDSASIEEVQDWLFPASM